MNTNLNLNELELNELELSELNGGFVVTGTMVAVGIGVFVGTFGTGYLIGQATK